MKKTLLFALTLGFAIACTASFLTACGEKHHFGEWVIDEKASCYNSGKQYRVCQDEGCNYLEWEEIPQFEHEFKHDPNLNYRNPNIDHTTRHSVRCTKCGACWFSGEDHSFDNSGVCTICGYDKENDTYIRLN